MCFGPELALLAASMGASVAGSKIASNEADQNQAGIMRARNQALQESLSRQRKFRDENAATLASTTGRFERPAQEAATAQAVDTRTAATTGNMAPPAAEAGDIPLQGSAPKVIKSAIAERMADAFRKSTETAKARAKFGGAYGDVWNGNNIAIGGGGRGIDTVNGFARAEAGMLPSDMDLAGYSASKPSSGIGQTLQALGALGSMYTGAGMPGLSGLTGAVTPIASSTAATNLAGSAPSWLNPTTLLYGVR